MKKGKFKRNLIFGFVILVYLLLPFFPHAADPIENEEYSFSNLVVVPALEKAGDFFSQTLRDIGSGVLGAFKTACRYYVKFSSFVGSFFGSSTASLAGPSEDEPDLTDIRVTDDEAFQLARADVPECQNCSYPPFRLLAYSDEGVSTGDLSGLTSDVRGLLKIDSLFIQVQTALVDILRQISFSKISSGGSGAVDNDLLTGTINELRNELKSQIDENTRIIGLTEIGRASCRERV